MTRLLPGLALATVTACGLAALACHAQALDRVRAYRAGECPL